MAASIVDILVEQGAQFLRTSTIKDSSGAVIDISNWQFRGQIRKSYSDPRKLAEFTFNIVVDPAILSGPNKVVQWSLSDEETAAIPVDEATDSSRPYTLAIYDIEYATDSGQPFKRLYQGTVSISPEVTK